MDMHGKVAIVTGAGQGIGKAIALHFAQQGIRVTIAEIDEAAGSETVEELGHPGQILYIPTDVAVEDQVQDMVARTLQLWGRVDFLINNAGIAQAHGPTVADLSLERWNRVLAVNLTGLFLCTKHTSPHLKAQHGAIVNIASTRALMSEGNTEAYAASKGGVVAISHALAVSLGPNVRVNCISPGWIDVSGWKKRALRREARHSPEDHAQHPAGRIGRPEDVAALALFLISPEASFITGANFIVDGGMTRKMHYI
ncbi:glucose 1-dehydrogenase [Syntrophorhabdus aromaticivorans]|uniref:glucose 1-dehydrogenase n=1 Tax=Syntrophorhabdus aromaticivorans TaxID=328301 RepID=UPI00041BD19D|nr:glucose 1-dehydrogenase [Syntrophorhabdus aromaticivorans]